MHIKYKTHLKILVLEGKFLKAPAVVDSKCSKPNDDKIS